MAKPKCIPLKITAKLVDGQIDSTDGIIMFDSILYHGWFYKYAPHVLEGQGDDGWSGYIGLPLRQLANNRWDASRAVYKEVARSVQHINRRPDFFAADKYDKFSDNKGIISDSIGEFRAYRMPHIIRIIEGGILTFYAVGHKDEIEELLSYIPAVGKKCSVGWGIVKEWIVEEIDDCYTTYHPEYGLMRPIEVDSEEARRADFDLSKYPIMQYAIKPPYWKQKNLRLCYVPIPEV